MRFLIPVTFFLVFIASCSKEKLDGFNNDIPFAQDFAVDPATGDTVYALFIPGGFTPNGDGINDYYSVYGWGIDSSGYEMRVYTREGNSIYYSDDPYRSYDGRALGFSEINPVGIYTIHLIVTDIMGVEHRYNYDIFLAN